MTELRRRRIIAAQIMVSGNGDNPTPPGLIPSLLRGDVREVLARHADVALAALVVLIVGMMIVAIVPISSHASVDIAT